MALFNPSSLQLLNFTSNLSTDQVIYTKSDMVSWTAATTYTYDTGLGDSCLPIGLFSLNGTDWYEQSTSDGTNNFGFPTVSDSGVISVVFNSAPAAPQTLYIRLMCLAKSIQTPFLTAPTGSALAYKSTDNYMKVAASGTITTPIVSNAEQSVIQLIPHNLGYIPLYRIFGRYNRSGVFETRLMSANERPRIKVDSTYLNFDNYMTNPFIQLQIFQYYYVIYYD